MKAKTIIIAVIVAIVLTDSFVVYHSCTPKAKKTATANDDDLFKFRAINAMTAVRHMDQLTAQERADSLRRVSR